MATWTKGMFSTYSCRVGAFDVEIALAGSAPHGWYATVAGRRLKARWPSDEEARHGALAAARKMFTAAAQACLEEET